MKKKSIQETDWRNILADSSRSLIDSVVSLVEMKPELFVTLFELVFANEKQYSQRAARVVYYLIAGRPDLFEKYSEIILEKIPEMPDESIKFSLLKVFNVCKLPKDEEKLGLLTNICFDLVEAKVTRIALKVYAIEVLFRISAIYPDIKRELIFLLEKYSNGAQTAFKTRARKIIISLKTELGIKIEEE